MIRPAPADGQGGEVRDRPWVAAILLFLLALALRLLFWQATPDSGWAGSAWYRGDAATWLEWAGALQRGLPFESDLPIRPPGAAYLIAGVWNGTPEGIPVVKLLWCVLGALAVPLLFLAVRRSFGAGTALGVGVLCAGSTGLLVLSTSLNNETPYLVLLAATLALWQPTARSHRLALVAWAALHAGACLLRAEHLLYFSMSLVLLALASKLPGRRRAADLVLAGAVFVLCLVPWHLSAWRAIERFNTEPLPMDRATDQVLGRVERVVAGIPWAPEAETELQTLPAATRRTSRLFVTATVGVRGDARVPAGGLEILDQAFGVIPEPLAARPYLSLYGGLNFLLANHQGSTGGFSRAPLERPPPLTGGAHRYPTALVRGLPPARLSLTYPPHLEAVNHGYRMGLDWIWSEPGAYARLAVRKLVLFWSGASLGVGGYNLPLGLSGSRRPVDLVVPSGGILPRLWSLAVLAMVVAGMWWGRRDPDLAPWSLFLLSKGVVTLAFFGYGRQGATTIPVVILLVCLAAGRVWNALARSDSRRLLRPVGLAAAVAVLLLTVEGVRWLKPPEVRLDGIVIGAASPFPPHDHRERRVEAETRPGR